MSSANEFLGAWVLVFCLVGPAAAVDIVSDAGHEGRGEGVPGITYPAVFSVKVQIGGGTNSAVGAEPTVRAPLPRSFP